MEIKRRSESIGGFERRFQIMFVLFAFLARLIASLTIPVCGDGTWYLSIARYVARHSALPPPYSMEIGWIPLTRPPLHSITLAFFYSVFSPFNVSETGMKVGISILGTLNVFFCLVLLKKLIKTELAYLSAMFLALFPMDIFYSSAGYTESTTILFFTISLIVYLKLISDPSIKNAFFLGICIGLTMLSHFDGIIIVPIIILSSIVLYTSSVYKMSDFFRKLCISVLLASGMAGSWFLRNLIEVGILTIPQLESQVVDISRLQVILSLTTWEDIFGRFWGVGTVVKHFLRFQELVGINLPFALILWLMVTGFLTFLFLQGAFKAVLCRKKSFYEYIVLSCLSVSLSFIIYRICLAVVDPGNVRYLLPSISMWISLPAYGLEDFFRGLWRLAPKCAFPKKKISKKIFSAFSKERLVLLCFILAYATTIIHGHLRGREFDNIYSGSISFVRENVPQGSIILVPDPDHCTLVYRLDRPLIWFGEMKGRPKFSEINVPKDDAPTLAAYLSKFNIKYVWRDKLRSIQLFNSLIDKLFMASLLRQVYGDDDVTIYFLQET